MSLLRWPQWTRPLSWVPLVAMALASWLAADMIQRLSRPAGSPIEKPAWDGAWIHSVDPGHKGFFRRTFEIESNVSNAWIQLAADNEYALFVNGVEVGSHLHLESNTYSFQGQLSEVGQRVSASIPWAVPANPELQWAASESWRVSTVYDLRPFLRDGRNVLAIFAQSDRARARIRLDGAVDFESGRSVSLASGSQWRARSLEESQAGAPWYERGFQDLMWNPARVDGFDVDPVGVVDRLAFAAPFFEKAIGLGDAAREGLSLRIPLVLESVPRRAWLRLHAPSPVDLFVNGHHIALNRVAEGDALERHTAGARGWADPQRRVAVVDLAPALQSGLNVIALRVHGHLDLVSPQEEAPVYVDGFLRESSNSGGRWLAADGSWRVSRRPKSGWLNPGFDDSQWDSPHLVPLEPAALPARVYVGAARFPLKSRLFSAGLALGLFAVLWLLSQLGRALFKRRGILVSDFSRILALVLAPGLTLLLMGQVLAYQWQENSSVLWTTGPTFYLACLLASVGVSGVLALFVLKVRWELPAISPRTVSRLRWVFLATLVVVAALLRFYDIGFQPLQHDENISLSAARGIHQGWAPTFPSGVNYTRSPLFHYMLAGWTSIFGANAVGGRLLSAFFGMALLLVVYRFARGVGASWTVALLTVGFLAIDPWSVFLSRSVRFYVPMTLFATLALLAFVRGFVLARNENSQAKFFVFLSLAFLCQEVVIILIPGFVVGYLLFAEPFSWRRDKTALLGLALFVSVAALDIVGNQFLIYTNLVGISRTSGSIVSFHLLNPFTFVTALFVGHQRSMLLFSLLCIAGLPMWLRRRDRVHTFLYLYLGLCLMTATVLLQDVRLRYVVALQPIFIFLVVSTVVQFIRWLASRDAPGIPMLVAARRFGAGALLVVVLAGLVGSLQPRRLLASYRSHINMAESDAWRMALRMRQPGDVVIYAHPYAAVPDPSVPAYYFNPVVAFDLIFRSDGVMIDRWGGGVMIDSLDKLRAVLERTDRAWLVVNDRVVRKLDEDMGHFFRTELTAVYQPFYANVYLWDRTASHQWDLPRGGGEKTLF